MCGHFALTTPTELVAAQFDVPEAQVVREQADCIPEYATVRLSAAMIDGPAPKDWPHTSTVVTE